MEIGTGLPSTLKAILLGSLEMPGNHDSFGSGSNKIKGSLKYN